MGVACWTLPEGPPSRVDHRAREQDDHQVTRLRATPGVLSGSISSNGVVASSIAPIPVHGYPPGRPGPCGSVNGELGERLHLRTPSTGQQQVKESPTGTTSPPRCITRTTRFKQSIDGGARKPGTLRLPIRQQSVNRSDQKTSDHTLYYYQRPATLHAVRQDGPGGGCDYTHVYDQPIG